MFAALGSIFSNYFQENMNQKNAQQLENPPNHLMPKKPK